MPLENRAGSTRWAPRRLLASVAGALVVIGLMVAALMHRGGDEGAGSMAAPSSTTLAEAPTTTSSRPRDQLVSRLREILKVRDNAFRTRNSRLLEDVYTVDCPCLEGDKNAIEELKKNDYHVVGGTTSIRVRRVQRINDRLWLIVADFRSARLRVETADNQLIREEEAGSDLFQFALAKPVGSNEWLLGRAIPYRDG